MRNFTFICAGLVLAIALAWPALAQTPDQSTTQKLNSPALTADGKIDVTRYTGENTWFLWQLGHFDTIEYEVNLLTNPSYKLSNRNHALKNYYTATWRVLHPDYTELEYVDRLWREAYRTWVAAKPNSPTPHLFHAYYLKSKGWSYRGDGFARDVSDFDMNMFVTLLKEAKQVLESCRKVCSESPEYYRLLVDLDGAGGRTKTIMTHVKEGIARFPHDHSIYMTTANFLLPIWGGSFKQLFELSEYAVKTSGKNGSDLLYSVVIGSARHEVLTVHLRRNPKLWPRIKNSLEALVAEIPQVNNRRLYLELACDAMDADGVQRMHALVYKQDVDPAKFCRWPVTAQYVNDKSNGPAQRKLGPPELTPEELHRRRELPKRTGGQSSLR
ncbi:MAG: hypothetical protein SH859_11535 [Hyphomicrobium aestuarii]|nr:hypothetical protein [Hyphomicrobium aestuarii]